MSSPIVCPNCRGDVPERNVNGVRMVAVCPTCDTVFQFGDSKPTVATDDQHLPIHKPRKSVPSRALRTFDDPTTGGFEIHKQDRNAGAGGSNMGFMVFFTLIWDAFMVMWFVIALNTGAYGMALAGTLHGAVGVGLTYWLLAHYLNMTRLIVTQDEIRVITTPVYVHAPRRLATAHIDQLYVRQTEYAANGKHHYEVVADTLDVGTVKVVGGFLNYADAAYVEQEIEQFLNITDAPVPGEANPHRLAY